METGLRSMLTPSILLVLKPIVRLLLKAGIPVREFNEMAKQVYVEVATREYGIRGRPTNVSRTAILTGLNRRNVARIRDSSRPTALDEGFVTPASALLSAWYTDRAYLDAEGRPALLKLDGPKPSFESLAKAYTPDLPHTALFKELRGAGALLIESDGRARALMRDYLPNSYDPDQIRLWGSALHDMAQTLTHNLTRSAGEPSRYERRVVASSIPSAQISPFCDFLESESQEFLEKINVWVSQHTAPDAGGAPRGTVRLGAGIYMVVSSTKTE